MSESKDIQDARQLANLQLQVNALEAAARDGSLPEMLKQTRRTISWSALLVSVALIVSSVLRACRDTGTGSLERRIEALERGTRQP